MTINQITIPLDEMPDELLVLASDNGNAASLDVIHDAAIKFLEYAKSMYEKDRFEYHPGVDCFIVHSSVWDKVQFGELFLGSPLCS